MTNFQTVNPVYNLGTGTPVNGAANMQPGANVQAPVQPYPSAVTSPYYNYPTTSLYGAQGAQSAQFVQPGFPPGAPAQGVQPGQNGRKQQVSGVNIYIYNPTGIGGGSPSVFTDQQQPVAQTPLQPITNIQNNDNGGMPATITNATPSAIAASPVSANNETKESNETNNEGKTKQVTQLTDNYIRTLESYLRSPDSAVRKTGIQELINRFEEDKTRFDNPALTALLNIALQDPDDNNRFTAISPIAAGSAHGDNNTILLLQGLQSSDKMFGQEAQLATQAILKASEEKTNIPDDTPASDRNRT